MKNFYGIGLSTIDISYKEKENQQNNVHKELEYLEISLGGTIGNALVVISGFGGSAYYSGRIGNCLKGTLKRNFLLEKKIQILNERKTYTEKDIVLIKVDSKGERYFASATDHRGEVDLKLLYEKVNDGDYIILDGHYCECVLPFLQFLRRKKINVVIVVSVAKPEPNLWPEDIHYLFPYADYIIGGAGILKKIDVKRLVAQGIKIIQTNGHKPIECISSDEIVYVNVNKMDDIKDTTGAGDFFLGTFVWLISNGKDYLESIRTAARIASDSCCYYGNSYIEEIKKCMT